MSLLDTTITNIALGNIQRTLKTDLSTVSWIMNAYTLTFAALLVTMGRLADQFGRKRLYMGGMILFSVGSLLCAVAATIEVLIGCRVIQAIGASILEAVGLAIIVGVFPKEQRTAAIGLWGALAGLAAAVGPVLGGFLLELGRGNLEGRWIFFVNLPFCLIGLAMIARNVPEIVDRDATRRIDSFGVLTLAVGILALALGFTKATAWGWGSARVLGLFGVSALALLVLYAVEARQKWHRRRGDDTTACRGGAAHRGALPARSATASPLGRVTRWTLHRDTRTNTWVFYLPSSPVLTHSAACSRANSIGARVGLHACLLLTCNADDVGRMFPDIAVIVPPLPGSTP